MWIDSTSGARSSDRIPAILRAFRPVAIISSFDRYIQRAPPAFLAGLFAVTLTAAEVTTTYVSPLFGIAMHTLLLFATVVASARVSSQRVMAFVMPLMLLPMIRIVSMGIPLGSFPRSMWFLLPGLAMLAGILVVKRALGLGARQVGLYPPALRHIPLSLAVVIAGVFVGVVEYRILRPEGIDAGGGATLAFAVLAVALGSGLMEELLFRGVLLTTAQVVFRGVPAVLFTSLLFAIMHIGNRSMVDVAFVFVVGLMYGYVAYRTRSIISVTLAHCATNVVVFILLPTMPS